MTMKRTFDLVVSAAALVVSAPIMAVIAILVRASSPGPVIYKSARVGHGGQRLEMLKFRTMVDKAPDLRNADGSTYNASDDPRVTGIGAWLRRTSLDELPQLWNVLQRRHEPGRPETRPVRISRRTIRPRISGDSR